MFRRPPHLSTRGEDTYDYLTDDLDEQVLSFSHFLKTKANGLVRLDSFDLIMCIPIPNLPIMLVDQLRRKT